MSTNQATQFWQEMLNQAPQGMATWMEQSQNWLRAMQQMQQGMNPAGAAQGAAPAPEMPQLTFDPGKVLDLQRDYLRQATELWNQCLHERPELKDRRFKSDAWGKNSVASFTAAMYLLNSRTLMAMAELAEGDAKAKARLRFAVEQWVSAASPSNFLAFNAEAQKKAIETHGESLAKGVANMLHDLRQGHVSMTDESQFEVGKNLAVTEGAVIFENEFFQLIEYKPTTEKVYERPLLLVPPSINKFYILDLQPKNSFARYAIEQGQHVFLMSWRNPDASLERATWEDYIEQGIIKAIHTVQEASGSKKLNVLGFCVGGAMLTCALAVLAARGEDPAAGLTLLTTMLNYADTGILDIFIDEPTVRYREMQMGGAGMMRGQDLASTFSFLRPNELVWNYVAGNYLMGEMPAAFDILYWNSDSTNLPGPFYAWYLRNTYLENNLMVPGKLTVCGEKVDLTAIKSDAYIYGSREDHIVPIGSAYASTQILTGDKRFVMGASGHIAGVVNPPAAKKRSHWLREDGKFPESLQEWIDGATETPGSWWDDWAKWLAARSGKQIAAPGGYAGTVIEPAPGRYVKVRL